MMGRLPRSFVLLLAAFALAPPPSAAAKDPDNPPCLAWQAESRYIGFAYDHWVHLRNGCDQAVACTITTSSNPDPIEVSLAPGKARSLLTFRASPARDFRASVRCVKSREAPSDDASDD